MEESQRASCSRRASLVVVALAVAQSLPGAVRNQKPLLSHTSISHEGKSGYSIHHGQDDGQRKRLPTCGLWLVWGQMEGEGSHP